MNGWALPRSGGSGGRRGLTAVGQTADLRSSSPAPLSLKMPTGRNRGVRRRRLLAVNISITVHRSASGNPKGIPSCSPGLRITRYPGTRAQESPTTLQGVASECRPKDAPPSGLMASPARNSEGFVPRNPGLEITGCLGLLYFLPHLKLARQPWPTFVDCGSHPSAHQHGSDGLKSLEILIYPRIESGTPART
jgi:hypothetical protein